jgi:hypothetical protein
MKLPEVSSCRCKGCAGHQAFGVTIGHVNSYDWGLGVVVGDWGIGCEIVPIGARINNACVMSWKCRGGDVEQIQLLERNNIIFYTS